jgi:hypothetical protein
MCNSYANWVNSNITREEHVSNLKLILEIWTEKDLIKYDKDSGLYYFNSAYNNTLSTSLIVSLCKKIIPLTGIKKRSLINALHNSLTKMVPNAPDRLTLINKFIEEHVHNKFLVKSSDGKYYKNPNW